VIEQLKDCSVRLTLRIEANAPTGFDEATVQALNEASRSLDFSDSRFKSA